MSYRIERGYMHESYLRWYSNLARDALYTTVRGAFKMAPIDPAALAVMKRFVRNRQPYGCYWARYGVGAERAYHTDKGEPHERLIVMLQRADKGGELTVGGERVDLFAGDGVIFRADLCEHAVSLVEAGERVIFTLGRLIV